MDYAQLRKSCNVQVMYAFQSDIEQLAGALGITRGDLLLMAQELAGDPDLRGLWDLQPSLLYQLLLLLERLRDSQNVIAQVRNRAMIAAWQ